MANTCSEDICLWPDGTWCYRHELWEMTHMSDDYEVVLFGTPMHDEVCGDTHIVVVANLGGRPHDPARSYLLGAELWIWMIDVDEIDPYVAAFDIPHVNLESARRGFIASEKALLDDAAIGTRI